MEAQIILILGCTVLTCGSIGLLIARFTNPALKGLGWLGGAFAVGGASAAVLAGITQYSPLAVLLADLLVLLAFVLLHVAVLELAGSASLVPRLGLALLAVQGAGDLLQLGVPHVRLRVFLATLTIAVQSAQTGWALWKFSEQQIRIPALFSSVLLLAFTAFNLVRSVLFGLHLVHNPTLLYRSWVVSYTLYIAVALGLAFGFFWMTTALLSSRLDHLASTDPLTRLFNRRIFLMWCEKELVRATESGDPFSILMIDLDHFKQINDRFGHSAGDQAICAAVEQMQDSVRGVDVLARWGGEEFTCMLPNASLEAAHIVAERMRANIEKMALVVPSSTAGPEETVRLTASIGVATHTPADNLASMLDRADQGLYMAKSSGRNRVCVQLDSPPMLELAPQVWARSEGGPRVTA